MSQAFPAAAALVPALRSFSSAPALLIVLPCFVVGSSQIHIIATAMQHSVKTTPADADAPQQQDLHEERYESSSVRGDSAPPPLTLAANQMQPDDRLQREKERK